MNSENTARRRSVDEYAQHIERLLAPLDALAPEDVGLTTALGRVPVADVVATLDLPVFRNSQMDGYAVGAESITQVPATLTVHGIVAAGDAGTEALPAGGAIKIMTGAPLPPGADCVVPVEDTTFDDGVVTIVRARAAGDFVREPGDDVRRGTVLVAAGTVLEARHIAALAAVGTTAVAVRRRPRVAVITTGSELVTAGTELGPGQIYDSNGIALASCVTANGGDVVAILHSSDAVTEFDAVLRTAAAQADVILTSGGVSMGDFEVVRDLLEPLGGEFGHIAMQPGGPQGCAVFADVPVLCFPGNPVSTVVSFDVFARPILRRVAGLPPLPTGEVTLSQPVTSIPGKRQFLRGKRSGDEVTVVRGPGSHLVAAMAAADVLIDIPAETVSLPAGATVKVTPL